MTVEDGYPDPPEANVKKLAESYGWSEEYARRWLEDAIRQVWNAEPVNVERPRR